MSGGAGSLRRAAKAVIGLLSSFGLACAVLLCMFVLTFAGTLHQGTIGLHAAQLKYFDAWFLWAAFGPVSVPVFPAGMTLMVLLFVNLVLGGMVRLRKTWTRAGIMITHLGIAGLLLSGLVRFYFADEGHMTLAEGQRSQWFESYYDWEIAIGRIDGDGTVRELVIPHEDFAHPGAPPRTFTSARLPFDLTVSGFQRNCQPMPATAAMPVRHSTRPVDGFFLQPRALQVEAEQHRAGCYVTVVEKESGEAHEAVLWGAEAYPFVVTVGGESFSIGLQHRRWQMPFVTALEHTEREVYPRTETPRSFESRIRKIEGGTEQEVVISMNEPLRHKGFVMYQSNWGELPNGTRWSGFSVARNPSDQWPLISCVVIAIGLVLHFSRKLFRHVRTEAGRHA